MDTYKQIIDNQVEWAKNRGLSLIGSEIERGFKSYTTDLNKNLFLELSDATVREINKGDGGELLTSDGKPARMQALHSSSATGVNIFEYWRFKNDLSIILNACKLTQASYQIEGELQFEVQYPIKKNFGKSPNLDVVIRPNSHSYKAYAIECKFAEPYSSHNHRGVKEKYFDLEDIWSNLDKTMALAEEISPDDEKFSYLHAAQLIKHILGLNQHYGHGKYRLLYLWYNAYGKDGYTHQKEIENFKSVVEQDGVKFSSITYQELILRLADYRKEHNRYISYITERYL